MIRTETSIHINRPPADVFAYVEDLSNLHEWIEIFAESVVSESTTRLGTRVTNRIDLLGLHFTSVMELTEHEPNRKMVLHVEEPFRATGTFLFDAEGEGTRCTAILEAQPGGFFRVGEPILTAVGQRRFRGHLRRLKARLESSTAPARRHVA